MRKVQQLMTKNTFLMKKQNKCKGGKINNVFAWEAIHGLSVCERWMLFSDVILDAGGRLEGHGAAGAFVEQFTMSLLDVRFDRVQSSEHHQATGASAGRPTTTGMSGDVALLNANPLMKVGGGGRHHTCIQHGAQSANMSHPGVFGTAAGRPGTRTLGRRVVCSCGGCAGELRRCSCWTGGSEGSTRCRSREGEEGVERWRGT